MNPESPRYPLEPLEPLVGEWRMEASISGEVMGVGRSTFEWLDDRKFVVQRTEGDLTEDANEQWQQNSPLPTIVVIGLDDSSHGYSHLYADARGVHRVYEMSLSDGVWKIWRDAPGFFQRFTATISDDGDTITGYWEGSGDGSDWSHDFDVTFKRLG
jgi:hypothetical protein